MFFRKKKIRKLINDLDKSKRPIDLQSVVDAIEVESPAMPTAAFQNNLRKQLLLKHKNMPKSKGTVSKKQKKSSGPLFQLPSFKAWSYAVAVLLIVFVASAVSYPFIPAPHVVGYSLKENVRQISYNAPIKVVFSQPMDHGSTEKAFHIEPTVQGKFEWSGNSMMFLPDEKFKVGDTYAVYVEESAKSLLQKSMEHGYEETFEIVGAPQVLLFNPVDESKEIPSDAKITVMFDRPMTALKSLDDGESDTPEFIIEPKVNGRMKWLGTDSISFIPDSLKYSTTYNVTIPKGTKSAEGGVTDDDFSFSFTTITPELLSISPNHNSQYNGPSTKVNLQFNQPMNLSEVKDYVFLTEVGGDNEEIPYSASYFTLDDYKEEVGEEAFENYYKDSENADPVNLEKQIVLTPTKKLSYNSTYRVKIDKDFGPVEGDYTLKDDINSTFSTVGEVKIVETTPVNGINMETDNDPRTGNPYKGRRSHISFKFSHPMEPGSEDYDISDHIVVSPEIIDEDTNEAEKPSVGISSTNLTVRYGFEPSSDYTVTVKAGLKDQYGQQLEEDYVLKFRTPALAPAFNLMSQSDISIIDNNKDPVYYVKTTNLDTLNFKFKQLSDDEFNAIYSRGYVNQKAMKSLEGPFVSWSKTVEDKFNEEVTTRIDLSREVHKPLYPGMYYLDVRSPGINQYNGEPRVSRQLFIVSSSTLAIKRSNEELLVWATSINDGSPISGFDISVQNSAGEELHAGKTDTNGLVTFKLDNGTTGNYYSNDYTIIGRSDDDFTMTHSSWSDGISPWNFDIDFSPVQSKYYVYSYTDRPIYRPGHKVNFKGLVRRDIDAKFSLPKNQDVHVTISDSQGDMLFEEDLALNSNGTFSGDLSLGENAKIGNYTIITSFNESDGGSYLNTFRTSFKVAEYRKPDYELLIETDKDSYVNGETANINVKGAYFFGAPMPNARIEWTIKTSDYFFFIPYDSDSIYASKWYSFSDEGYLCYWGCEGNTEVVTNGKAQLNSDGEYTIELPMSVSEKGMSQLVSLEVTAFDLNNQSVSNRSTLPVHAGEYYMGIVNEDYVVKVGEDVNFEVVSVDHDGMPVANKKSDVSFYKREWNTIKKKNLDGGFYYENSYDDTLIESKSITTDGKGYSTVSFSTKDGGNFKAVVSSTDSYGNTIKASTSVYVSSSSYVNWGRENNDRIELVADKLEYNPGETAHILVKSPYQNVWALVTRERHNILSKEVIKIDSNSFTIDVPIDEDSIPNIFVSVVLVKGSANEAGLIEPPAGSNDERSVASFKVGYTTLQVNNSSKSLNIDVTSDQEKYHPQDEVSLKVKTVDESGNPVSAEVSVSVVDKSVISLTENVTADLINAFYRKRLLGVSTAHTLTKAIARVNVQVEAGLKGGGGAVREKRGEFKDTAYWNATVETDSNGDGEVVFTVPDNLTTWEVLAIGITDDTLVGSQKYEFLVTKDVIIRPVLPRFMIVNDKMKVGAIVHNYMDKEMLFEVSLDAVGVKLGNASQTQTVALAPDKEAKIEWDITVENQKEAVLTFDAKSSKDNSVGDILEKHIPIHPYSFPEVVATSKTIDDSVKNVETIWIPIGTDQNFGELNVSVSPTLTGSLHEGIEYLMRFPYGCTEQTTSALLPNVVLKQVMDLPTVNDELVDTKQLKENVETALQTLYKYQKSSGGWGIWETSTPTPYLSSYVLFTLNETKKAGYSVDQKVIDNGVNYLTSYMNSHSLSDYSATSAERDKSNARYEANSRAYALYVLAEIGKPDLGLTNNLYLKKEQLNIFSKAYLAMTYHKIASQDDSADVGEKITSLKNEITNLAKESPRGMHFEESQNMYRLFGTNTRTTAIVMQMLSRIEPDHPYIPKILRWLMSQKKDGHYSSTQETAVGLIAMVDYLKSSKELEADYDALVHLNGAEKVNKAFTGDNVTEQEAVTIPLTELVPDNQDNELTFVRDGVGKMYADVTMKYYIPTEEVKPRNEGITVTHEYFAVDDDKMENPVENVKLGENIKARITVVVPEDRHYVMIEDFLPAGLEGIDFSLKTSQQSLDKNSNNRNFGGYYGRYSYYNNWYFNHSEVRDNRMMYFADFLPKGVYELEYYLRATSPGVFHDLPVLAQELYFPEVFGRSQGHMFEVVE